MSKNLKSRATDSVPKLKRKYFEKELQKLQVELVHLQQWVRRKDERVVIIFEGRDAAGKGGVIKSIAERTNPRIFRVTALPAPTDRQKTQLYMQRYIPHLPAAGEIVVFDRSWYNRAGVERVMGFCTDKESCHFLETTPNFENSLIDDGIRLIKYWFEVSDAVQVQRFKQRMEDPMRLWKLSPMDLESHRRWFDYSRARDEMFAATDTNESPWHVVHADDKRRARLNCISHLLSQIPYEKLPRRKLKLPHRQKQGTYEQPEHPYRYVPSKY